MPTPGKAALDRLQQVPTVIPNVNCTPLEECSKKTLAKLVSKRAVLLTQDKSAEYIDLPIFQGEREISESHVQVLLDKMIAGTFNPQLVILASCSYNGQTYKINGQHTCWAKFFLPQYTPEVEEQIYEADSMEQVKLLYNSFDSNKPRHESHRLKIFLSGEDSIEGISSHTLGHIASGIRIWHYYSKEENKRARAEHLSELIRSKYPTLVQTVGNYWQSLTQNQQTGLKRAPTMAAIIGTFQRDSGAAMIFWNAVATGAELKEGDPRLALRNYILTVTLHAGKNNGKKAVDNDSLFWVCILAWNKWRCKGTLNSIRVPKERPEIL